MKKVLFAAALFGLVLPAGCIPCLHAIYKEGNLVFESALVGTWSDANSPADTWKFTKAGEKSYRLVYTTKGKKGVFDAHLAKIDGTMFLDLYPKEPELRGNDFYKLHYVPTHTFLLVEEITSTLKMRAMNIDWLKKYLEKNPDAVRHEKRDGGIIFTASTEELQTFLTKAKTIEGAFGEPSNFKRQESKKAEK